MFIWKVGKLVRRQRLPLSAPGNAGKFGELPLEQHVKILRVLQEKEIERIGGKGTIKLDIRIIAPTNRNLAKEVQARRFRADLYCRLATVELLVPPLREWSKDIEPLTMYFAQKYAAKFSRQIKSVSNQNAC